MLFYCEDSEEIARFSFLLVCLKITQEFGPNISYEKKTQLSHDNSSLYWQDDKFALS